MKPSDEIQQIIASLTGWTDNAECGLLYDLASQIDDHCIIEIGSHKGKSTVALAMGSRDGYGVNVYAVDPQLPFDSEAGTKFDGPRNKAEFFDNITKLGLAEIVYIVNLTSRQTAIAWQEPIGLLFIDGDHRKAQEDLELWHPYLVDSGLLAIHDYETWERPREAYQQALVWGYEAVETIGGLGILQKHEGPYSQAHLPEWILMTYRGPEAGAFHIRGRESQCEYLCSGLGSKVAVRSIDEDQFREEGFTDDNESRTYRLRTLGPQHTTEPA